MGDHTLRNQVCTGQATLPLAFCIAAAVWMLTAHEIPQDWWLFLCLGATTIVLRLVVNSLVLIRERSWFLSACFIVLSAAFTFQHDFLWSMLSLPLFVLSQYLLLLTYQAARPQGMVFYAVLLLALAGLLFPPLLLILPVYWAVMLLHLQSFTAHSLAASFLALGVALLSLLGWCWLRPDTWHALSAWLASCLSVQPQAALQWTVQQWVNIGYLLLLLAVSLLHFNGTKWGDKIRTRMHFYAIITLNLALVCLLALYPQHYATLSYFIVLQSAPLVAHFMVLGQGRGVDFAFGLLLISTAALIVFNLWSPLLNFS